MESSDMHTFKKVVAATVMVLSVLVLIGLVVGIVGSWILKAQLEASGVQFLLSAETAVTGVSSGLTRANSLLGDAADGLNQIDSRVGEIGAVVEENRLIVDGVLERLQVDVVPAIQAASELVDALEENLIAVYEAIDAIGNIPLLRLDVSDLRVVSLIEETVGLIQQLRVDVDSLVQETRQQRQDLIQGAQSIVTSRTGGIRDSLTTTITQLGSTNDRLDDLAARLASLRERLPRILTNIVIVLNLFFAFSLLAFASLFLHAWQYFKCPDDGLRALLPPDQCQEERVLTAATAASKL
jgi:hypothetical protein